MSRPPRVVLADELAARQASIVAGEEGVAPLGIQAPMVRCSRAAFRETCRRWGTDITYTHMFVAESIAKSADARAAEMSFVEGESRVVGQIAATDPDIAGQAAVHLAPYVDAIDLNCGCPQRWAMAEGFGAALMQHPQLVSEMVKSVRRTAGLPCVVKTRVFDEPAKSVDWARQQEAAGAAWVTIHGRMPRDPPSCPVRWETVKVVRESLACPTVLNGGVDSRAAGLALAKQAGVGGVMSARGVLSNPALFAGYDECPKECLADFLRLAILYDTRTTVLLNHVTHMTERQLAPQERSHLAQQRSIPGIVATLHAANLLPQHSVDS